MIATDIFIEIGSQHKVCEDYIIKGMEPEPFIILADGCSSSDNTEMGARLLCHLAKQYLRYRADDLHGIDHKKMGRWIIHNAEMTARQLGLNISCLDATLLVSYYIDGEVVVHMYGDGAIVVKDGKNFIYKLVDFTRNAPYYLSYLVDDTRQQIYHDLKNDLFINERINDHEPVETQQAYDADLVFRFNAQEFDCMFIASDGLTSFIDNNPTQRSPHPIDEITPGFMAFKNTNGEFLKRRMKKAMRDMENMGIVHFDDLSIGAYIRG